MKPQWRNQLARSFQMWMVATEHSGAHYCQLLV